MTVREELWPGNQAYSMALRQLPMAFAGRPDLAGGTLRSGPVKGFAWSAAGANAVVFCMTTASGRWVAIRCFTRRPQRDVDERYRALGSFLQSNPCPLLAGFEWIDGAIRVDGKFWPILQMEWIDGDPLKRFVTQHLACRSEIEALSDTWTKKVADLGHQKIAHGDLQHGNVIVASSSDMRFVDLDGVWCEATARDPASETGLPAYQHPERIRKGAWDESMDRFSSIVIYVSLRAIASAPRPGDILAQGDALVLSADDINMARDQGARDEAWRFLLESPSREVCLLAEELHQACRRSLREVPSLGEFIGRLSVRDVTVVPPNGGMARDNKPLNEWGPPSATTVPIQNVWGASSSAEAASGKRVKAQATHQQWAGSTGPAGGGTTPGQQTWGGRPSQPPPPKPTPIPTGTGGSSGDNVLAALALVFGVLVILFGLLVAVGTVVDATNGDGSYGGVFGGFIIAAIGGGMVSWGRGKLRQ